MRPIPPHEAVGFGPNQRMDGWMQGCRNDATGMLKSSRERKGMGIPARSKDPLARQCSTGEMSFQRGSGLRARISAQAVVQAQLILKCQQDHSGAYS